MATSDGVAPGVAAARLQVLRRVVSPEYSGAIDAALCVLEPTKQLVDRDRVVSLLTARAAATDYIVLREVLLDMAEAVSGL